MGIFGLGRKKGVVDLGERYRQQQERAAQIRQDAEGDNVDLNSDSIGQTPVAEGFGFLGSMAGAGSSESSTDSNYLDITSDVGEKRKKLAKRFMEMTERIEDLSNQIYHLQQRIEVLERKAGVGMS